MTKGRNKNREAIVLGALLHDIGKFWQRADSKYSESDSLLKAYPNKQYDVNVPVYDNGHPKYVHSLWTNAFLTETNTGAKLGLKGGKDLSLENLSANHHKPNNHLEAIISIADKWSSGIDRPDEGEEGVAGYAEVKRIYQKDFVKKVKLHSIFDTINKEYEEISHADSNIFPLVPLDIEEDLFTTKNDTKLAEEEYRQLWKQFREEYNQLLGTVDNNEPDFKSFYTSLVTLLKKYTWSIPSATNLLPACVSLFEHLKSTAAIALSLYDFYEDHNTELQLVNNRIAKLPDQDSLLMVCIDISGIQKFIYDISNRRAAVSLKGRSFYLEILLRTVLRQILNHNSINAYDSNVVYSSGGKAYLILPNLDRVKEGLREIQAKVSKELFNDTQAKLFISIGSTSFRYETNFGEITGGNHTGKMGFLNLVKSQDQSSIDRYTTDEDATFTLSMLWRSVSDKAAEQKNRKFKKVLLDDFDRLFLSGKDFEQSSDKCIVTGQRIKGKVEYLYPEAVGADRGPVGEKVYQQIQLGKDLRSSNVIKYHDNGRYDVLGMSGTFSISDISDREVVSKSIYLNKWPDFTKGSHGKEHIFYGGNHLSGSRSNAPKTFEELCTYVNNDVHKVSKLGVLRMDVDNLGQIFIKGIAEPSFAAYSTLSMLLDLFFSGIINKIQLSNPDYKDHIQILYSGGDDVFAVGRWDALLDFAVELRKKFELFTQRADIGLSAGMAIVGAKYPIYKAAEESGNAEKQAKNYKSDKYGDKNAFCIFGEAISWNQEWDTVTELKNRFLQNIGSTGSGFLHTVQNLKLRKDDHHNQLQKGKDGDLSYIWHSAYKLSRMEKSNKDTGAKELIKDIVKNVQQNTQYGSDRYIDLASIAARWAELLHKMNK